MTKNTEKTFSYKGKPIVRYGNTIYFGNLSEKDIIVMKILEDLDVASKVEVQLQRTSSNIKSKDRIVKKIEKLGLYSAFDIGIIWLERALISE